MSLPARCLDHEPLRLQSLLLLTYNQSMARSPALTLEAKLGLPEPPPSDSLVLVIESLESLGFHVESLRQEGLACLVGKSSIGILEKVVLMNVNA